jgi:hypothetical protein
MIIKYALIKYLAILISVVQGVVFVWAVTLHFSNSDLTFVLLVFGLITYLILFDFGLGKPIYSLLRKRYVGCSLRLNRDVVLGRTILSVLTGIVTIVSVGLFSALYFVYSPSQIPFISVAFIALFAGVSVGITMIKDLFDAVDEFVFWEGHDLTRKFLLFLFTFFIYFDPSLISFSFSLFFINLLLFFSLFRRLHFLYPGKLPSHFIIRIRKFLKDAFYNFQFKTYELFIYNWGYVIFPFFSDQLLLLYSVFNRLFLGTSVGIRAITDIYIHSLTKMFFNEQYAELKKKVDVILLLGIVGSSVVIALLIVFTVELNAYWLNNRVFLDEVVIIAFSFYLIGNAITHTSGLLLISTGASFKLMSVFSRNIFFVTLILVLLAMYLIEVDSAILLVVSGAVYFIASFWYLYAIKEKIKVSIS